MDWRKYCTCNCVPRYIPAVDTPCYSTYMGCGKRYFASTVQDNTFNTNPKCPYKVCNLCSGSDCKCNLNHMKNPYVKRYFVYDWNQY